MQDADDTAVQLTEMARTVIVAPDRTHVVPFVDRLTMTAVPPTPASRASQAMIHSPSVES